MHTTNGLQIFQFCSDVNEGVVLNGRHLRRVLLRVKTQSDQFVEGRNGATVQSRQLVVVQIAKNTKRHDVH